MAMNKKLEQMARDMNNKEWRMANLYYIKPASGPKIKFNMNATQIAIQKAGGRFNATLKSRQRGVTTYYALRYLDDVLYNENTTAAIIADKQENIVKIFRIVRFAYKNIPDHLKPKVDKGGGSKYEMYFPNTESRIYVSLEVRSERVQKLHVSEYGLMKNRDRYDASTDAVPMKDGEISIESTANGLNHFYKDWIDPEWDFQRHFFPWFTHEENFIEMFAGEKMRLTVLEKDLIAMAKEKHNFTMTKEHIKWRRAKIKQKGTLAKLLVEHPEDEQTCFMSSGKTVLDVARIKDLLLDVKPPFKTIGPIHIYEPRDNDETYVCACDTAGGTGGDYYVGTIYRASDWKQCAQVRNNKWRPSEFGDYVVEMCDFYTKTGVSPVLCVERNNHGHAVLQHLNEVLYYPNLYYHEGYDDKLGWHTTSLTRPIMMDHYVEAVESGILKMQSKELLAENLTLIDNNGKIEAQDGEHDDCIIASAIAVQLLQKARKLELWDNLDNMTAVG